MQESKRGKIQNSMQLTEQRVRDLVNPHHEEYTPEVADLHMEISKTIADWLPEEGIDGIGMIDDLTGRILIVIYNNMNKDV